MVTCSHFIAPRCTVFCTRKIFFAAVAVYVCSCISIYYVYGWLGKGHPVKVRLFGGIDKQWNASLNCSSLQELARLPAWNSPTGELLTELPPTIEKNCSILRAGDEEEVRNLKELQKTWKDSEAQEQFNFWIKGDCPSIAHVFNNNFYISQEELDFPIAFAMLVHTNALQVVRLLRTIYRPHNLYCIHPDAKQSSYFISVFRKLAECLDNVIVASKLYKVYWGYHTIMDAELSCMYDLLHFEGHQWKYVINIGGQELPLKTNKEIVGALRHLKGASVVNGEPISQEIYNERFVKAVILFRKRVIQTPRNLSPVPHGIKLYKGTHFFSITRSFAKFILTNQKAVDFREYLREVFIPEEEFYVSLYMLPEAPVKRLPYEEMPVVDLYFWESQSKQYCTGGVIVRDICILGVSELHNIHLIGVGAKQKVFFMNKYDSKRDHACCDGLHGGMAAEAECL